MSNSRLGSKVRALRRRKRVSQTEELARLRRENARILEKVTRARATSNNYRSE